MLKLSSLLKCCVFDLSEKQQVENILSFRMEIYCLGDFDFMYFSRRR